MRALNQHAVVSFLAPAYLRRAQIAADAIARQWDLRGTTSTYRRPRLKAQVMLSDGFRIVGNALFVTWTAGALASWLVVLAGFLR
jgi:hypothetical protein